MHWRGSVCPPRAREGWPSGLRWWPRPEGMLRTKNARHPTKAGSPMQACAVHLCPRTPRRLSGIALAQRGMRGVESGSRTLAAAGPCLRPPASFQKTFSIYVFLFPKVFLLMLVTGLARAWQGLVPVLFSTCPSVARHLSRGWWGVGYRRRFGNGTKRGKGGAGCRAGGALAGSCGGHGRCAARGSGRGVVGVPVPAGGGSL